jgi:hypothetical protein
LENEKFIGAENNGKHSREQAGDEVVTTPMNRVVTSRSHIQILPRINLANFTGQWHVARMQRFTRFLSGVIAAAAALSGFSVLADTTNLFGFSGKEVYPIDQGISELHVADLDGDGLNDIIVVNNLRAKINLLYNRTGKTNITDAAPVSKLEINDLPPDARFRIDSLPSDERISALGVVDLNGDGRPDLVYFGDTKDLIVRYNLGTNGWSEPKLWHLEDGRLDANALATGDLNGDGLTDIAFLGLFSRPAGGSHVCRSGKNPLLGHPQGHPDCGCGWRRQKRPVAGGF